MLRSQSVSPLVNILRAISFAAIWGGVAFASTPTFVVEFERSIREKPFTGRVYVFFSERNPEPRLGPDWFQPEPFIAKEVTDWQPGTPLMLSADDPSVLSFPKPFAEIDLSDHRAQAVARFNPFERKIGNGAGNGFGPPKQLAANVNMVHLTIDRIGEEPPYQETEWGKLIGVRSKLLSDFHGRDVFIRGTVILPSSYHKQSQRRYPTILTIPGFGGDHCIDPVREPIPEMNQGGVEFLRVILDPTSPLGHHVFANSANNGPVGDALVTEFLPAFDRQFRSITAPTARFVTGHSSGGWSSLWLQISHPDDFGGVWSTAPDPVDFRDFQRINIYRAGENMYVDRDGNERPLARRNGEVVLTYRNFDRMEQVLGPGGQLHSFEAVFSPKGDDGRPKLLWNRTTGEIDPTVAEAWKDYDIRLVLQKNWSDVGPKLAGKVHVFMGEEDTFYLEGATRLLKESLDRIGSDAVVELVPSRDHFDLLTPELRNRIRSEMTAMFLNHHDAH